MAADEKRINVSIDGDATGLESEIDRVGKKASDAFKELGFDEVLQEAADKFEKRVDQIKYVMDQLNQDKADTLKIFNERIGKATNEAGKGKITGEREERIEQLNKAIDSLKRVFEKFDKDLKGGKIDENGNKIVKPEEERVEPAEADPQQRSLNRNRIGQQLMRGNFTGALRSLFGGGGGAAGGAAEGAAGAEGGAAAGGGAALGWIAAALAIFKLAQVGMEDARADNKLRAMGAADDDFNVGQYNQFTRLGMDRTDAKKAMLEDSRSMVGYGRDMSRQDMKAGLIDYSSTRQSFEKGYGIDAGNQRELDQFFRQNKENSNEIIAEMFIRQNKNITGADGQILGSLANEKLGQVVSLLQFQKQRSERVDSRMASSLLVAGQRIGGQYGDDRAADKTNTLLDNLSNPKSDFMKAFLFKILSQKYGNLPDTIAAIEGLSSNSEDLGLVTGQMGKTFGKGNLSKLLLGSYGMNLFGNQVDANKFLGGNGFGVYGQELSNKNAVGKGAIQQQIEAAKDRGANLTLNLDTLKVEAKNVAIYSGRMVTATGERQAGDNRNRDLIQENPVNPGFGPGFPPF